MGALSSLNPVRQGLKLKLEIVGREASIAGALCYAGTEYWLATLLASKALYRGSRMNPIVGRRERAAHAPVSQLFPVHRADL